MHNIDSVDNNNLDLSSKKDVANYAGSLVGKYSITAENKDVHEKIDSEKIAFQECAEKVILAQEKLEEAARNALERFDESDLSKGLKVVVCGPPHSGKSVFIRGIESMLDPNSTYVLDCTPDGEFRNFNKYYDDPQVRALREKLKREASDRGGFTEKFIKDKKE